MRESTGASSRKSTGSYGAYRSPSGKTSPTSAARATRRRRIVEQQHTQSQKGEQSPPQPERGGRGHRHDRVVPANSYDSRQDSSAAAPSAKARRSPRSHKSRSPKSRRGGSEMVGKGGAAASTSNGGGSFRDRLRKPLNVDAGAAEAEAEARKNGKNGGVSTPQTDLSTPSSTGSTPSSSKTPAGHRGRGDLRSPGVKKSPEPPQDGAADQYDDEPSPLADFITQTDKYGNASTPRSESAVARARKGHASGPQPHIHVRADGKPVDDQGHVVGNGHPPCVSAGRDAAEETDGHEKPDGMEVDACDALLESLRMMCCCLLPEDQQGAAKAASASVGADDTADAKADQQSATVASGDTEATGNTAAEDSKSNHATREANVTTMVQEEPEDDLDRVRLLPKHHPDDVGKKCLVLDLDETLVHSSFRAVPGADFVIPVQIEDVVHFVYVMKRPGVDEFLVEMAKYYEVVIYTASLNKYADPLLDLLDPHRTIRTRLFRESCVYYEGNYVKDMSLIDRDLSQAIIVDNSPSSYMFHPENAIDCSSFIDDPNDRELDQIGAFLAGIRDIQDVRHVCNLWRDWPNIPPVPGLILEEDEMNDEER